MPSSVDSMTSSEVLQHHESNVDLKNIAEWTSRFQHTFTEQHISPQLIRMMPYYCKDALEELMGFVRWVKGKGQILELYSAHFLNSIVAIYATNTLFLERFLQFLKEDNLYSLHHAVLEAVSAYNKDYSFMRPMYADAPKTYLENVAVTFDDTNFQKIYAIFGIHGVQQILFFIAGSRNDTARLRFNVFLHHHILTKQNERAAFVAFALQHEQAWQNFENIFKKEAYMLLIAQKCDEALLMMHSQPEQIARLSDTLLLEVMTSLTQKKMTQCVANNLQKIIKIIDAQVRDLKEIYVVLNQIESRLDSCAQSARDPDVRFLELRANIHEGMKKDEKDRASELRDVLYEKLRSLSSASNTIATRFALIQERCEKTGETWWMMAAKNPKMLDMLLTCFQQENLEALSPQLQDWFNHLQQLKAYLSAPELSGSTDYYKALNMYICLLVHSDAYVQNQHSFEQRLQGFVIGKSVTYWQTWYALQTMLKKAALLNLPMVLAWSAVRTMLKKATLLNLQMVLESMSQHAHINTSLKRFAEQESPYETFAAHCEDICVAFEKCLIPSDITDILRAQLKTLRPAICLELSTGSQAFQLNDEPVAPCPTPVTPCFSENDEPVAPCPTPVTPCFSENDEIAGPCPTPVTPRSTSAELVVEIGMPMTEQKLVSSLSESNLSFFAKDNTPNPRSNSFTRGCKVVTADSRWSVYSPGTGEMYYQERRLLQHLMRYWLQGEHKRRRMWSVPFPVIEHSSRSESRFYFRL